MQLYILISNKCNLNCSICIRSNSNNNESTMDYETFVKMFQSNDFSNEEIVISGGEPTVHDSFTKIVAYTCQNARKVFVTTNGTNNYYVDELSMYDNLNFQVSLDGDKTTNDTIRGKGAYSKIIDTLNKFEKNQMKYSIASVVSKKNVDTIKNLIPLLSKLNNMKYWRISYEMPFGNSFFNDMLLADEWNLFVDDMVKSAKFRLKIQKIFHFKLYDKKLLENKKELIVKRSYNCGSGREKLYIYPDLNVYSCACLTDFSLGNLSEVTLEEVISGEKIKQFSEYHMNINTFCRACDYFRFCNGGCIGMSYHYFGALGKGDIRCPLLRRHYE